MADFIDDEVLEMAAAREVDANHFYLALAARVKNPRIKKIFKKLAAEELEHRAKIELEIMKSGRVVKQKNKSDFQDEENDPSLPEIKMSYKDILLMGIEKEEASIRLYTDLAAMVSDNDSKEILSALAKEETGHKERFQKIMDFLAYIS